MTTLSFERPKRSYSEEPSKPQPPHSFSISRPSTQSVAFALLISCGSATLTSLLIGEAVTGAGYVRVVSSTSGAGLAAVVNGLDVVAEFGV